MVARLSDVFADALLGVYVFGSAALGDWVDGSSDVDVAVVVGAAALTPARLDRVVNQLDHAALPVPARKLELVVYSDTAAASGHPRFALNLNTGPNDPTTADRDAATVPGFWFVLDVAIGREHGVALTGPPVAACFAAPLPEAIRTALIEALDWDHPDPRSVALAACRAWHHLEEGGWSSKSQAARWAAERLRTLDPGAAAALAGAGPVDAALAARVRRRAVAAASRGA